MPNPVFFDIATSNGTATAGSDYVARSVTGLKIPAGATSFTFPDKVADGAIYAVTVAANPAGLVCDVTNNAGAMPSGPVTTLAVTCRQP